MSKILREICFRFTTRTQGTRQVATMSLQNEFLFLLSFLATVSGVFGGEYCYSGLAFRKYCTYGCCYNNTNCCSPKYSFIGSPVQTNVALIVGLTVLGVLVVSTIIAIICCCVRRRAAAGTVIRTNPGPGVMIASSQTAMSSGQPMPYQPGYQPAPYAPQPGAYPPQAYPMGTQAPPVHAYGAPGANPAAGVPTAPPYTQADGGQVNAGYDNKY